MNPKIPMKTFHSILAASVISLVLQCGHVCGQGQPGPNWGNMDPQQLQQMIQQRIMDNLREQMGVTNDTEWSVIKDRLAKVTRLRTETMLSTAMGMMGGMRRGPNGPGGGFPGFAALGKPDPDVERLQNYVDSNAPTEQIKTALDKLREARKQKQAELAKAQDDLRLVLTVRQEAILVVSGMLD